MSAAGFRARDRRVEIRCTEEEKDLIDRAVAAKGTDRTEFIISSASNEARRVLADRTEFFLDPEEFAAWDELNSRPARDLPGVRALMNRPSPFTE